MRFLVALLALISCAPQVLADEDAQRESLQEFATHGLDMESPLLLETIDTLTSKLGLPERIDIDVENGHWDIDIRETDAHWVFDGFTVTTRFYEDGDSSGSTIVPGPPKLDYRVYGLSVTAESVGTASSVRVGSSAAEVIEAFGMQGRANEEISRIVYTVETEADRDIVVLFVLDEPDGEVIEIHWSTKSWH